MILPVAALISAVVLLLSLGQSAQSQTLPVRVHKEIKTFRGDPDRTIAVEGAARYTLLSAHKEGGRPWADAIWLRQSPEGETMLSRGYDCARDLYRWLGEAKDFRGISLSVRSIEQTRYRPLTPGTLEHRLAAHACGL